MSEDSPRVAHNRLPLAIVGTGRRVAQVIRPIDQQIKGRVPHSSEA